MTFSGMQAYAESLGPVDYDDGLADFAAAADLLVPLPTATDTNTEQETTR